MPVDVISIAQEVQDMVDKFADKMSPIQKELYSKVSATLKDLDVDAKGNIKRTVSNLNKISSANVQLNSLLNDPRYQKNVAGLKASLEEIAKLQTSMFGEIITDFEQPTVIDSAYKQAFKQVVTDLTETGMNANVLTQANKIVSDGITSGSSFEEMNTKLKDFLIGNKDIDGKLQSYTKQVVSDTLHGASRTYNSIVTEDLGLKWYRYVGALVKTSRQWCIELEHKEWIHESELGKICRGDIDGKKVSLQGLMPDTNKENVVNRCGGYNCSHHMVPVPSESVPLRLRQKFEEKEPAKAKTTIPKRKK